jgi:hypothetical protein
VQKGSSIPFINCTHRNIVEYYILNTLTINAWHVISFMLDILFLEEHMFVNKVCFFYFSFFPPFFLFSTQASPHYINPGTAVALRTHVKPRKKITNCTLTIHIPGVWGFHFVVMKIDVGETCCFCLQFWRNPGKINLNLITSVSNCKQNSSLELRYQPATLHRVKT